MVPVTLTVYGLLAALAALATTKDPDMLPLTTLHSGLEMRPLGVEEIEHPVSRTLKPLPVIRTCVPTCPTVGNKSIIAVTVKVAIPTSPPGTPTPVTVTIYGPEEAVATVNVPVTIPPAVITQVNPAVTGGVGASVQDESPMAKPLPETAMTPPIGPEDGVRVTTCGIMFKVAVAKTVGSPPSVTLMMSLRPLNVTSTVKEPPLPNVKSAATLQTGAGAAGLTEAPVMVQGPGVRKLEPVTITWSPTRAGLGVSVCEICGTTLKVLLTEPPGVHVSVSVADWAGTPAPPTVNDPVTDPPDTFTVYWRLVTTLAPEGVVPTVPPVRVQVVAVVKPVKWLALKLIVSPPPPEPGVNIIVSPTAFAGGVATNETEIKSAEVSNSTINRELELRVVNLETHS